MYLLFIAPRPAGGGCGAQPALHRAPQHGPAAQREHESVYLSIYIYIYIYIHVYIYIYIYITHSYACI